MARPWRRPKPKQRAIFAPFGHTSSLNSGSLVPDPYDCAGKAFSWKPICSRRGELEDPGRAERAVQAVAAAIGLAIAGVVSFRIGSSVGTDIGLAAFALSWALVAAFVLFARFLYRRFARDLAPRRPLVAPSSTTRPQTRG